MNVVGIALRPESMSTNIIQRKEPIYSRFFYSRPGIFSDEMFDKITETKNFILAESKTSGGKVINLEPSHKTILGAEFRLTKSKKAEESTPTDRMSRLLNSLCLGGGSYALFNKYSSIIYEG